MSLHRNSTYIYIFIDAIIKYHKTSRLKSKVILYNVLDDSQARINQSSNSRIFRSFRLFAYKLILDQAIALIQPLIRQCFVASYAVSVTNTEESILNIVHEYYELLTKPETSQLDTDLNRIQEILCQAENNDDLSLILNEIDNFVIQNSSSNYDCENYNIEYQKVAGVVKIHVNSCDQIDSELSQLMTKISSLLREMKALKASKVFESASGSSQLIDTKVQSLTLLKEEAEVEQERRWLKYCLNDSEPE